MRAHETWRGEANSAGGAGGVREHPLLALQRQAGNAAVGRLLSSPRFAGVAKLEACAADRDRLAEGDRGDPVTRVQQGLADLGRGYDLGRKGADGVYGPKTAGAIRRFKADESLGSTAHGDMKAKTIRALDRLYATATGKKPGATTEPRGSVRLVRHDPLRFIDKSFQGFQSVVADIAPGPRARFAEYRQFVKGATFAGPTPDRMTNQSFQAGNHEPLSPTDFKEDTDGNPLGGYGHRDRTLPGILDEYSKPDRATGTHYRNEDSPGFFGPVESVHMLVDLDFMAMLVDTHKDHPGRPETPIPGTTISWPVKGSWPPP
ncbi:hypothetical protein Afil01_54160 [Actinorhabdospora filicis]|uniref:Peptidoglycan binding-like domain-containing protein n=1 Tax=Actinorhabdospora filicis TaxID=1785913 RepID=A0A9W6SPI1_9ACTN|nr:peptidoglycan-binding protein [Actinorhabdospora filicis]GLZ80609.1 hypothetical protein Afil01_54160 [Actinorhabdospora filicis]